MKFGVLQFFSWPGRRVPLETVYERAFDRVRIMDSGGYDAVWLAEHHFSTYSVCPSVHIMGMHVAHITKNLRIGTAVSLAAFYHPLRLAEEVALLDHLSGGRVNWGAGRGFDRTEMEAFNVDPAESADVFRENFQIVLRAWQDGRFSFEGRYHQYHDIEVLPKPLQDPIPVWLAAGSDSAVQWSAENGHAILVGPHSTFGETADKLSLYRSTLDDHGHAVSQDIPIARLIAIGDSHRQAEQIARAGVQWTVQSYAGPRSPDQSVEERIQTYIDSVVVYGTPEEVIDQLLELESTIPMNYLLAAPLSHDSFLKLSDEVVPILSDV